MMSIVSHAPLSRNDSLDKQQTSGAIVPASIAILLAAAVAITTFMPHALILPAIALAATALSTLCGIAGWLSSGPVKSRALTAAGIFAVAAIAAAMTGDPDQVALWLK